MENANILVRDSGGMLLKNSMRENALSVLGVSPLSNDNGEAHAAFIAALRNLAAEGKDDGLLERTRQALRSKDAGGLSRALVEAVQLPGMHEAIALVLA